MQTDVIVDDVNKVHMGLKIDLYYLKGFKVAVWHLHTLLVK